MSGWYPIRYGVYLGREQVTVRRTRSLPAESGYSRYTLRQQSVLSDTSWPTPEQIVGGQVGSASARSAVRRAGTGSASPAVSICSGGYRSGWTGHPGGRAGDRQKPHFADELASFVTGQGGRSLIGHCHPSGSFSLPIGVWPGHVGERSDDGSKVVWVLSGGAQSVSIEKGCHRLLVLLGRDRAEVIFPK